MAEADPNEHMKRWIRRSKEWVKVQEAVLRADVLAVRHSLEVAEAERACAKAGRVLVALDRQALVDQQARAVRAVGLRGIGEDNMTAAELECHARRSFERADDAARLAALLRSAPVRG